MTLDELRARVPTLSCLPGCSDCCGLVFMSRIEQERIQDAGGVKRPGDCEYLQDHRCSVYGERPFICRLFGVAEGDSHLACPHGCKAADPLSAAETDVLISEYAATVGDWHECATVGASIRYVGKALVAFRDGKPYLASDFV